MKSKKKRQGKRLDFEDRIHIEAYVRKSQGARAPYDIVRRKFGQDFLDTIGIRRIPNKKVRLLPIA